MMAEDSTIWPPPCRRVGAVETEEAQMSATNTESRKHNMKMVWALEET
jgi:hypothetical protein